MGDAIDDLIEMVTVDAYGEYEQLSSFCQAFEDEDRFPWRALVVGVELDVTGIDFDGDERRGLIAVCRRDGQPYSVSLLDVTPTGPLTVETRQLVDAYRRWSGAGPLPSPRSGPTTWLYPRFGRASFAIDEPLALTAEGLWDPAEEYWGEPDQPRHPLESVIMAAGARPCFEMDQVLPGVDPEDWDSDPIVDAADLHRAGEDRAARHILERLLKIDRRCIDAWGHLGLIAFDTKGPGAAAAFYETGVAVGEASLPDGFAGVLPWGMVDNRPFLRCLHGLALCAWRQRRWDDAAAMFTARVWLDPNGAHGELACLNAVRAHSRWSRK